MTPAPEFPWPRAGLIGGVVGSVLYLTLDSGVVSSEPVSPYASVSLGVLGILFALGSWAMLVGGQPARSPLLAGLALGVAGYAVVRLVAF